MASLAALSGVTGPLESLPLDVILVIAAALSPDDLLEFGCVCTCFVEIGRANALWKFHIAALAAEHPNTTIGWHPSDQAFEHYISFRVALDSAAVAADLELIDDFKQKPSAFRSLAALGTISDAGESSARFDHFGGGLPEQVPGAAALELLELMQTVPRDKGVCIGTACEKAAKILGVSSQALDGLKKRVKEARRGRRLVLQLRAPFPMLNPGPKTSASVEMELADAAIVAEVMRADEKDLTPRKLAMRRSLFRSQGDLAALKAEFAAYKARAEAEKKEMVDKLHASTHELERLQLRVEQLEFEQSETTDDTAARRALRRAERALAEQQLVQSAVEQQADAVATQLQQARDRLATDWVARKREEERLKKLLQAREAQSNRDRQAAALARKAEAAARHAQSEAERAAEQLKRDLKRKRGEWRMAEEAEAIRQAASGQCDSHFEFLAGCVVSTVQGGANKHFKQANAHRRGPGYAVMRVTKAKKGFGDLGHSQKDVRSKELSSMMVSAAGSEEHVVPLMVHHRKANPELYKQIGLKERNVLTVDALVSMCVRVTGALGKQLHRALKANGVDVGSYSAVQRSLKCSENSHETYKISRPNTNPKTKAKFPLVHGAILRVISVAEVLQRATDQHEESGDLEWPEMVPSGEIWIEFLADKGGGTDKRMAKHLCCSKPDSINMATLLALCDGIGDDYWAKREALGPVYKQIDQLNFDHFTIHSPWRPRLPKHIMLDDQRVPVYRPAILAKPAKNSCVEARLSVNKTLMGVTWVHLRVRPRARSASAAAGSATKTVTPSGGIFGKKKALMTPAKRPRPQLERDLLDPTVQEEPTVDHDSLFDSSLLEPSTARKRCRHQTRWPARTQRLAHCLTPVQGRVRPVVDPGPAPRLKGCTYNEDCDICSKEIDGELNAKRRHVAECDDWEPAPRRARFFHGGDMLSIMHPMGLQGPTSTEFCPACHARLNKTNAKGLSASRDDETPGVVDNREPHIRDPPFRLGSQAIRRSCMQLHAARRAFHKGEISRKPMEANYHSCANLPLFHVDLYHDECALIPLHIMLGQGLEIFNNVEAAAKNLDANVAESLGQLSGDEQLREKIIKAADEIEKLKAKLDGQREEEQSHLSGIELIESTHDSADAVARAQKPRPQLAADKPPYVPLPLEDEYRAHVTELALVRHSMKKIETALKDKKASVAELRALTPGYFEVAFLKIMSKLKLKREAYHGGAFVGDDIKALFDPGVFNLFCDLLADPIVFVNTTTSQDGRVHLKLIAPGSRSLQKDMIDLCSAFSDTMSLFGRGTPLCEHHIADFKVRTDRYARAYATVLPHRQPQPKTHLLCAEMPKQADRLGGTGILGEPMIEAAHVRDNNMKRQYASTRDICEQLRLRARGIDRLSDTRIANITEVEQSAAQTLRAKMSAASRKRKNLARPPLQAP